MKKLITHHLNKNEGLLKHGFIVFVAAIIGGFFNYLFQMYMARTLGPADYGILGALFSIMYIVTFSLGTIRTVITKFVSQYKAKNEQGKIHALLSGSFKRLSLYGAIGFVVYALISGIIADFLKVPSIMPVIIMGLFLWLTILVSVINGFLNGMQMFNWLGFNSILQSASKLLFGILLVSLGFGVGGAVMSLNLSAVLGIVLPLIPLAFIYKHEKKRIDHISLFQYSLPVFICTLSLMLITNLDMILVKHYFPNLEAGHYAAASMLAKVIWFASSALAISMFPKISELHTKNKSTTPMLRSTLFYTSLISFVIVAVYFVAPNFVVNILYGPDYNISGFIGLFSLGLGIFSLNAVLTNYNLAVKKTGFVYALVACVLIEIVAIVLFHSTLVDIIKTVVITNILLFVYLIFYTRKELGFENGKIISIDAGI